MGTRARTVESRGQERENGEGGLKSKSVLLYHNVHRTSSVSGQGSAHGAAAQVPQGRLHPWALGGWGQVAEKLEQETPACVLKSQGLRQR